MKLNIISLRSALLAKKLRVFTAGELQTIFKLSPRASLYYLERGLKVGLFTKVRRGLYILKTDPPAEQELANLIYRPSYLSFEYALAYYNLLPEMPYSTTSATTKPTKTIEVENRRFTYTHIKPKAYTGYQVITANDSQFLLAEPEKALVDYLYLVSLGRRPRNDRLVTHTLDTSKLIKYAHLFQRNSLNQLIRAYA